MSHPGKGKINRIAGYAAAAAALMTLVLAFLSMRAGTIVIRTDGNPKETVRQFYEAVIGRDYKTAYENMAIYSSLGLENPAENESVQELLLALRQSYAYELVGDPVTEGLHASQKVRFTCLDLAGVLEETGQNLESAINQKVQSQAKKESFDQNNNYRPQLLDASYEEALEKVMQQKQKYLMQTEYELQLTYDHGKWYIVPNEEMMKGFSGGLDF